MSHLTQHPSTFCTTETPLAIVGVSDKDFGGAIYEELKKRGYTVAPVNPKRGQFDGDRCYASLLELPPIIKHAVIALSPENASRVVEDAIDTGFTHLWFQQGKDFSEAITKANSAGMMTVSRKCILMYAPPVFGIHGFHRFIAKAIKQF